MPDESQIPFARRVPDAGEPRVGLLHSEQPALIAACAAALEKAGVPAAVDSSRGVRGEALSVWAKDAEIARPIVATIVERRARLASLPRQSTQVAPLPPPALSALLHRGPGRRGFPLF